ncbi:MAG: vWA domain-containing protein [Spirochaetota bacterium]
MEFQYIEYQWLLFIVVPVVILLYIWFRIKRKKDIDRISESIDKSKIINSNNLGMTIKFILLVFMLIFSIFALMRPKWGTRAVSISKKGFEIVFMLDVSPSMLSVDVKPNRLSQAKNIISEMVDRLEGNKFALITFSGEPTVDPPLTDDIRSFKEFYLKVASVEQIPVKGTVYSKALELAGELFSNRIDVGKAIIIVSDGESHDSGAVNIAEDLYKNKGILTYTIGVGTEEGSYIPLPDGSKKLNNEGKVINTKLRKETLENIAQQSGGKFAVSYGGEDELKAIYNGLNQLKKGNLGIRNLEMMKDQYQYFILVLIIIFIFYLLIPGRKIKFVKNT